MAKDHDDPRMDARLTAELADELLHLDEEEIVLAANDQHDEELAAHLAACPRCRERVDNARGLMRVSPICSHARPDRFDALMQRLTGLGAVPPEPRGSFIHVALGEGSLSVVNTNTEVRIQRSVATRRADAESDPAGVAFFRRVGGVEVEVHLIRVSGGRFHLVVGLASGAPPSDEWRVALHRGKRELAREPAPRGTVTFKSLSPGDYRIEVLDGARPTGVVQVTVERR